METLVGISLGGYRLTRVLGSGGMGTVYLAEDEAIGQQVAIKVVRTDDAEYPDSTSMLRAAERFKQEARAVASLDHLHILPLYRYGEEGTPAGQRAYMVMQYRPEGSLWDWLRQRAGIVSTESLTSLPHLPGGLNTTWPLSAEEAGDYLRQAASALQYAHGRGIVHRDVKPANFLLRLEPSNTTKMLTTHDLGHSVFLLLSDFGLAKFYSATSATSHVFGTPTYMAPEQFEGAAGPESDQYALAIMIYYFLAGRPPFEGDPMRLMHQHLAMEPPPIRAFAPPLSAGVESVLTRALAKQPKRRYPSITAFADAFTHSMYEAPRDGSHNAPSQFSLPNRRTHLNTPAQSMYAPYDSAGYGIGANSAPTVQSQFQVGSNTPQNMPVTAMPTSIAFAATVYPTAPKTTSLQQTPAQSWSSGQPTVSPPISPPPGSRPSEAHLVSRRSVLGWIIGGATVTVLGAGTGTYFYLRRSSTQVRYVLKGHTGPVTSLSWSPDGSQLVSGSLDHTARLWSADTQNSTLTYTRHQNAILAAAWNPDGMVLASGGRDKTVQVWDTTGSRRHNPYKFAAPVGSIVWSPQKLFVGTLGSGVYEILSGNNFPIQTQRGARTNIHALALSPDQRYLAVGADNGGIVLLDLQGVNRPTYYHTHRGSVLALAWSQDSTTLASGGSDTIAQVLDVRTRQILHRLPHNGAVNGIAWEPNNTNRLATASSDGNVHLWRADGSAYDIYKGHTSRVTSIAWGTRGLVSGSADTTIILWNV